MAEVQGKKIKKGLTKESAEQYLLFLLPSLKKEMGIDELFSGEDSGGDCPRSPLSQAGVAEFLELADYFAGAVGQRLRV